MTQPSLFAEPKTGAPTREPLTLRAGRQIVETWAEGWRRRGIDVELRRDGNGWVVVEAAR